jgi:hypothetical protein
MTMDQLRRALHHFKRLWDNKESEMNGQQRATLGFIQFTIEYWWLAMLMLEVEVARSAHILAGLPIKEDAEDTSQIHQIVRRFEDFTF